MRKKKLLTLLGCRWLVWIFLALVLMAATTPASTEEWPKQIVCGAFPKGSTDYGVHTAIATLISKYTPTQCIVREGAGSIPLVTGIKQGYTDISGLVAADLYTIYHGLKLFKGNAIDIRALAVTYEVPLAFGVRPKEGIETVSDLKGKAVRTKSPTWWVNELSENLIGYYKVDIRAVSGGHGMALTGPMVDKEIDAIFDSVTTGASLVIKQSVGLKWLPLSIEAAKYAISRVPGTEVYYIPDWIKKMHDMPLDKDFFVTGSPVYLYMLPGRLPEFVVSGILDAIFTPGHLDEVVGMSRDLLVMNLKRAVGSPDFLIPFDPGAIKYYKAKGLWTEKHEQRQKELLAKK